MSLRPHLKYLSSGATETTKKKTRTEVLLLSTSSVHGHDLCALSFSHRPSYALLLLLFHIGVQKTNLTLSYTVYPVCLSFLFLSPSMAWPLVFSFLCLCTCMYECVSENRSGFPPQGAMTSQTPLRFLVMLLFLCSLPWHEPCAAPQTSLMAGSLQHDFQKQCLEHKEVSFFLWDKHVFARFLWSQEMSNRKKIFSCRSHSLEDAGELQNWLPSVWLWLKMEPNVTVVNAKW